MSNEISEAQAASIHRGSGGNPKSLSSEFRRKLKLTDDIAESDAVSLKRKNYRTVTGLDHRIGTHHLVWC
ncbi:MAG: hypothetical protein ACK58T_49460 [Phycisphaerae bacterium]